MSTPPRLQTLPRPLQPESSPSPAIVVTVIAGARSLEPPFTRGLAHHETARCPQPTPAAVKLVDAGLSEMIAVS
ncbi:hypothetical protein GTA08_BOTSDO05547 [Botryosphaeria dothidea]|uniref:Uncharacterized protein n=1 Tax=Botryosphaeria dothidea TaxID=55169 RepID=A0A8H4ISI3_9PEZI|nr:hypothetical protein GTA08_BOTSDO05547 [Botryosphaeria dothidea]